MNVFMFHRSKYFEQDNNTKMSVKINWDDIESEETLFSTNEKQQYDKSFYTNEILDNTPLLVDENYTEILIKQDYHCHWKPKESQPEPVRQLYIAIILCFAFMICELIGGYFAGSLAIMCDAAHLLSDCAGFILALLAFQVAKRPADSAMTYGYRRAEVLGAMASVLLIWLMTGVFIYVAALRLYRNDFSIDADTMMIVSGIGVLVNIVMALVLHGSCSKIAHHHSHGGAACSHGHAHNGIASHSTLDRGFDSTAQVVDSIPDGIKINGHVPKGDISLRDFSNDNGSHKLSINKGRSNKSINLRAALIHVIGDLIQSTGVLAAAILVKYFPSAKLIDPICTFVFSILVLLTTRRVVKEAFAILMEAVPNHYSVRNVYNLFNKVHGVRGTHSVHIWGLTSSHVAMTAHVVIDENVDSDAVLRECVAIARDKLNVSNATIQVERYDTEMASCDDCRTV